MTVISLQNIIMAQSRLELIGTIYSRVTGLIKSGAIKSEQIPLWYSVYETFPPKYEPRFDRVDEKPVRKILYQEDIIRAKYYRTYGNWEVVNLFNDEKPTSQIYHWLLSLLLALFLDGLLVGHRGQPLKFSVVGTAERVRDS